MRDHTKLRAFASLRELRYQFNLARRLVVYSTKQYK